MGKHQSLQTHHFYLGAGGMLAVAALVIALTFGLSSAQTMDTTAEMQAGCTSAGGTWQGSSATPPCLMPSTSPTTCPSGQHSEWMNGVQSCVADINNATVSPPAGGCVAPTSFWDGTSCIAPIVTDTHSCPSGQWWDFSSNMCASSSATTCPSGQIYCPAVGTFSAGCYTGSCPTIGQSCPSGQWWDPARNVCTSSTTMNCDWSTQYWKSSTNSCAPKTNCTTVGSADYSTSECQGVRGTSSTTPTTCPSGQWWDASRNACSSSSTTTPGSCSVGMTWNGTSCVSSTTTNMNCDWNTQYWKSSTNSCASKTNCTTVGSADYSSSECQGVRTICPSGQWWDASRNACSSSSATMPGSCSAGMTWNGTSCTSSSIINIINVNCDWNTQYWKSSTNSCASKTNCTTVGSADYSTSECQGVRNTSTNNTATGQMWCPSLNKQATSAECEAATPICAAGQAPSATTNCRYPTCPSGQWWDSAKNVCSSSTTTPPTYGDCRNNATQLSCSAQPGCLWFTQNGSSFCEGDNYRTPGSCPSGQWWDPAKNACSGTTYTSGCTSTQWWDPASQSCKPMENYKPTCGPESQSCPDPWRSDSTMCMPKTRGGYWDSAAQKMVGGQNVTCEVLINEMKNPPVMPRPEDMRVCGPNEYPTPQNPCRMDGNQMRVCGPNEFPTPQNPCRKDVNVNFGQLDCSRDYLNPFCRSGKKGSELDPEFNLDNVKVEDIKIKANLFQEVEQLKREAIAKNKSQCLSPAPFPGPGPGPWPMPLPYVPMMTPAFGGPFGGPVAGPGGDPFGTGAMPYFQQPQSLECDLIRAKNDLKNGLLGAGMKCPTTNIDTVIVQAQAVLDEIRSLNAKTATVEQIRALRAKFNALRGSPDGDPGIMGKLNGYWNKETEMHTPGLIPALTDACSQIGYMKKEAEQKLMEKEFLKNSEAYKALQAFASNPLSYLPADVDVFAPFQWPKDPDACRPSEAEEEAMRAKWEAGMDEQGERMGSQCYVFDDPYQPKPECMPPVQRYLGYPNGKLAQLSKALEQASCTQRDDFEGRYACEDFAMAPKIMKKEAKFMARLEASVRSQIESLVAQGTAACEAGDYDKASELMGDMQELVWDHKGDEGLEFRDDAGRIIEQAKQEGKELTSKAVIELKETIEKLKKENATLSVAIQDLTVQVVKLTNDLGKAQEDFKQAQSQLARLESDESTRALARPLVTRTEELLKKAEEIFDALDGYKAVGDGKRYVQEAFQLTAGGISSATKDVVAKQAYTLATALSSGVLSTKEAVVKCKEFKEFVAAATNPDQEIDRLRAEGIPMFKGVPLTHWAGAIVLEGATEGLINTEKKEFNIGEKATGNHVLVRTVRDLANKNPEVAEKLAKWEAVKNQSSIPLEESVPGLADWARPFAKVVEELEVVYPEAKGFNIGDQIERDETTALKVRIYEAGLKGTDYSLPDGKDIPIPPDAAKNPFLHEIRIAKAMGIFSGCSAGDPNFCPDRGLNLGEEITNAVAASDFFDKQKEVQEEAASAERESADEEEADDSATDEEDFDFGDDDFEEESEEF